MVESSPRESRKYTDMQKAIKFQILNYDNWVNQDHSLINQYEIIQVFRQNQILDCWQGKTFVERGEYSSVYQVLGNWEKVIRKCDDEGLEIQQVIMKLPCQIKIRALAVELKLRAKISFFGSILIFTRVVDKITSDTPVLKIWKDYKLRGLFFVFGSLDKETKKFTFIKQKQITETVKFDEPNREMDIKVLDNGNDKIYVNISSSGDFKCIEDFSFCCSGFLPELRESEIWIGGTGEKVSIKNVSVQYKERLNVSEKRSDNCTCEVF